MVGLGVLSRAGHSTKEADRGTAVPEGSLTAKPQSSGNLRFQKGKNLGFMVDADVGVYESKGGGGKGGKWYAHSKKKIRTLRIWKDDTEPVKKPLDWLQF